DHSFDPSEGPIQYVNIAAVYPDGCGGCRCVQLTRCDNPEIVRYVYSALDSDGHSLNLREYLNKPVRLGDGYCYMVAIASSPTACANAEEDVEVLEAYDGDCTACKCWTLHDCESGDPGATVATYTDLAGLGFAVGQHFRDTKTNNCYRIVDDQADCAGAVGVTPEGRYYSCEHCEKHYRYLLTDDCTHQGCGEPGGDYDRHP